MRSLVRCWAAVTLCALSAQCQTDSASRPGRYLAGAAAFYSGDYGKAFREWQPLAAAGNADGEFEIGNLYLNGLGVAKNCGEAVKWTRRAAGQGQAMAEVNLGDMFSNGECLRKDYAEALQWYQKAILHNDFDGAAALGDAYFYGKGVPIDYAEAAQWYRSVANTNDAELDDVRQSRAHSLNQLAWMYRLGKGVPADATRVP
jgi:TPR repeat protein